MRIACSKYSKFDDLVILKATEIGIPLIGGTALEVWADYYNLKVRPRSTNDLDFISDDLVEVGIMEDWVKENIPQDKVKVDIYYVKSHDFSKYVREVDGVLIMSPEYLLWSKLTRSDRSQKDISDIKWILSIEQMSDEDLSSALEDLGVTEEEISIIQSLL